MKTDWFQQRLETRRSVGLVGVFSLRLSELLKAALSDEPSSSSAHFATAATLLYSRDRSCSLLAPLLALASVRAAVFLPLSV